MTDSIMFISGESDGYERSCFVCGQPITDLRKARELGDTTVLVHAGLCEKSLTDEPKPGTTPILCAFCTHAVGPDAVKRVVGDKVAWFHPEHARYFDSQVHNLASQMVASQAPKPVESNQPAKKTLSKSKQVPEYIPARTQDLVRIFGVEQVLAWEKSGDLKLLSDTE